MMTRWRSCVAFAVLLLATVPFCTEGVDAQQCQTSQCIRVNYQFDNQKLNWNKFCWIQSQGPDGTPWGIAYSDTYAANGYGTTPLNGAPGKMNTNGQKWQCTAVKDCANQGNVQSGTVDTLVGTQQPQNFNTDCVDAGTGTGGPGP